MNIINEPGGKPTITVERLGNKMSIIQEELIVGREEESREGLLHLLCSDLNPNDKRPYVLTNLGPWTLWFLNHAWLPAL